MPGHTDLDIDEIYKFAVQLGKDAGTLLQKAAESRFGLNAHHDVVQEKDSSVDIVTQTDEGE
jgi:myo-inositol-1(or 4)-monophosphatase